MIQGNTYLHQYHEAEFQVIAEQNGQFVCAWLDRDSGFRVDKGRAEQLVESGEWVEQ